ncbi:emopamil binding protein [Helicosporidium sp. ATCC 50920]|nr:emopamil binding protein [Helicosporidium sp. ATCC 50920]|eukprot:KDD76356.1 emopamil binding protein [Helicosporidium sp. ATCC 50920]
MLDFNRPLSCFLGREYAKADSRYATRDTFIIGMEAVTAFVWGPICLALVHGILSRKIWRYTMMIIVSLGQIYGDVLYYATCFMEGLVHSRPEALYFWIYFIFVNAIWIVVPSLCIHYAFGKLHHALALVDKKKKN